MKKTGIAAFLLVAALFLIGVTVLTSIPSQPVEAQLTQDLSKYDITGSANGIQLAQETVARWKQEGHCSACQGNQSVEVYKLAEGDYLIVPSSTVVEFKYTKLKDKSIRIDPWIYVGSGNQGNTSNASNTLTTNPPFYASTPGYPQCFARIDGTGGYIDHCVDIQKLYNNLDSTRDYYTLQHYATAKSKSAWFLHTATISCVKASGSSTMYWCDWNPKADQSVGNCITVNLGVQAGGATASMSGQLCDMWDITKYAAAGQFQNVWRGSAWRSERYVAYQVAVAVPQNGVAGWLVSASYYSTLSP